MAINDLIRHGLQIRFQLNIRFGYRILACDPDWTIFSSLKEKTQLTANSSKKTVSGGFFAVPANF